MGRYIDELVCSAPTKELHLAALRHFFDELLLRHVIVLNPAASVRGERFEAVDGKTPEISVKQARRLLDSLDCSHVVGKRDRAVIRILIYTAARVGEMIEKGGKFPELPMRHDLRGFEIDYIQATGSQDSESTSPLFRTAVRRTKKLTANPMTVNA